MSSIPTFDVFIAEAHDGYTVRAHATPSNHTPAAQPFQLPVDPRSLSAQRIDVGAWIEQARIVRRSAGSEELRRARALGTTLFEHTLTGDLLASYRASRKAVPLNQHLRLRLSLPAALVRLPWELLFDPQDDQFLALAPDLVVVRYPELPNPINPLQLNGPLRVVLIAASPRDLPPLSLDRELLRITSALKGPIERGQVVLDILRGPDTLSQLRARLRDTAHIVHFLGHGDLDSIGGEGYLCFEDIDGSTERINAELFRVHLQKQRGQTQLVVLNACLGALPASGDPFSSVGAALLRAGVPAVIAMQFAIPDDVATDLARVLYAELAAGTPVDLAVNETRMQLYGRHPSRLDWLIPVLFLRATDGVLFARTAMSQPAAVRTVQLTLPAPDAAPLPVSADVPQQARRRRGWLWLAGLLIVLLLAALGLFVRFQQPSGTTLAEAPGTLAGPASDAATLPEPRFSTPPPTAPPVSAINISNTAGRSELAQVAVDAAGVVHIVWQDNTPRQGQSDTVLYRSLTPDGTWSDVADLSPDLEYVTTPHLLVNHNRDVCLLIHAVAGIFARCLENTSWSPLEELVAGGTRNVLAPALSADRRPVWVAGLNNAEFAGVQISDTSAPVANAQLAIDAQGRYHLVWDGQGDLWSVEYRFSEDRGATWHPQQRLSADDAQLATGATLHADDQGAVHLVWTESGTLLYRRWTAPDGWGAALPFGTSSSAIGLAADRQGRPVVVWADNCEVRYTRLTADNTWTPTRVLNAGASPSACATNVALAIDDGGQQHIVWIVAGNDNQTDVFYARLTDDA